MVAISGVYRRYIAPVMLRHAVGHAVHAQARDAAVADMHPVRALPQA